MRLLMQLISFIFHPLLIVMYLSVLLIVLNPHQFGSTYWIDQDILIFKIFFASVLFPLISILMMKGLGIIQNFSLGDKKERIFPLIACLLFYIWLSVNIYFSATDVSSLKLIVIGASLALCLGFMMNTVFKISFHALGIGVFLVHTFLICSQYAIQSIGIINSYNAFGAAIIISGFVLSSRLFLKANHIHQLLIGFLIGLISQFFVYLILN